MTVPQLSPGGTTIQAVTATRQTYSVREAAVILGVGAPTLYRAIERKEVPAICIGRRRVMPKKWVDAQVECVS